MIKALVEPAPALRSPVLRAAALLSLAAGFAACADAGFPEVDNARWLGAGGTPHVKRVRDLGTRRPPETGPLVGESDGVASPGEYLLVEGSGFGKQPTVTVGGKAAEVEAHTVGGGVVVKVPTGVETGPQPVEVSVGELRSSLPFPIRRLLVSLHDGVVRFAELAGGEVRPMGASIPLPAAKAMVVTSDGACAYVATGAKLWIVDLGAAGGPKAVTSRDVALENVTGMVAAERAPIVFVVGEGGVQGFETVNARSPARYDVAALPVEVRGFTRAEVDADGKRMALLVPDGNRLLVVDVAKRDRTKLLGEVPVLPEARLPLVRDLRFSPDGDIVWVISGDGPGSTEAGTQPTRLTGARVQAPEGASAEQAGEGDVQVSFWRTALSPGAWAPMRLAVPRGRTVESGSTIRLPPEKIAVRFSSVNQSLLGLLPPGSAGHGGAGALEQSDATGEGGRLVETPFVMGQIEYVAGNGAILAAAAQGAAGAREYGIALLQFGKLAGALPTVEARFVKLGAAGEADLKPPFSLGEVHAQP